MRRFLLTTAIIITIGAVFAADLTIEADKQKFVDNKNKAYLEGNVKVQLDDITIKSPRAEGNVDPKSKKLTDANFFDKAYVYQIKNDKKNEVKANIIKLSLLNKIVTAEGNTQTIVTEKNKLEPLVIITADSQEYNTATKTMRALGNVIVNYQKSVSYSQEGIAKMDKKGEVEELQLIGNAKIKQEKNNFTADRYVYKVTSGDAVATGNVYSEMHGAESDESGAKKDDTPIIVRSEFQQYNKNANTLVASKNVRVTYKDYYAVGPKASVFPDPKTKKLNKVVFQGRSKITEQGRTIEADSIIMTIEPKDFTAEGNVKTFIPNVNTVQD